MKMVCKENIAAFFMIILVYIVGQFLINMGVVDSYIILNLIIIGINIILAVSLNLVTGFTGQFSLGHAAFMSIGAYVSAIVTTNFGQPLWVGIILAALVSAFAGVLIGIPTLRLNGDYLAIATLGFGEIIKIIGMNVDYIGGASGFNDIPQLTNWTWIYFMTVMTIILIRNFVKSKNGRACIAIREDEIAAEAMGINTTRYKVIAFSFGALFAGIAGALYANFFYFIKPDTFGFMKSIDILAMVVFGGMGSIMGSITGAVALSLMSLFLQGIPELRMVVYAVVLFLIMLYRPSGLLGNCSFKSLKIGGRANASTQGK